LFRAFRKLKSRRSFCSFTTDLVMTVFPAAGRSRPASGSRICDAVSKQRQFCATIRISRSFMRANAIRWSNISKIDRAALSSAAEVNDRGRL
jgi:hypothetical protein